MSSPAQAGGRWLATLSVIGLALALWAPPADAYRPLLTTAFLQTSEAPPIPTPPPEGQLEDPCGLASAPGGGLYVADYYHRTVDLFSAAGAYVSQIALPGGPISGLGINELDGVCGLALGSSGSLYGNEWHQGILRLAPSEFSLDSGNSTGLATDAAGDVFAGDRTYIAEYSAPVHAGEEPTRIIGLGSLIDGYGLAVSPDGSRVYVADAGAGLIKLYEPAIDTIAPVASFGHSFVSLHDAALALDPTNGHLLVLDNVQAGYEHPEAVIDEFGASGAFLGQLRGEPSAGAPLIDGGPSGLAVSASGDLYVTSGNTERGNVFHFGPYSVSAPAAPGAQVGLSAPATSPMSAPTPAASPAVPRSHSPSAEMRSHRRPRHRRRPHHRRGHRLNRRGSSAAASEVVQHGRFRVKVDAQLTPHRLPRRGSAPVHFALAARFIAVHGLPPQLRHIAVQINRHGRLDRTGLPLCRLEQIQPSSTAAALRACRTSLVGEGHFSASVKIPSESPFPSTGKLLAFNGFICASQLHGRQSSAPMRPISISSASGRLWPSRSRTQGRRGGERASLPGRGSSGGRFPESMSLSEREQRTGDLFARDPNPSDRGRRDAPCHRRPAILAHIYGPDPIPTSYTIPFLITDSRRGTFGTDLKASLPHFANKWGYVTSISLSLGRRYTYRGRSHSYLSAGCPAPSGLSVVPFPLTHTTFGFTGDQTVDTTLTRSCRAG